MNSVQQLSDNHSCERRLSFFPFVCVIYFTVSGGAFGIEPLVGAVGPRAAVFLIITTPFVWSLPMALMVAELATLFPEEGGYYIWVRESLGKFWAVQEAWWTMGYSISLMAMLPLLFVTYLDFFIQATGLHMSLGPLSRWLLAVAIIFSATIVNLFGARDVGRSSKISAALVIGSFAVLVVTWIVRHSDSASLGGIISQNLSAKEPSAVLLGLSYIVFNYSGWDNVSTYAGEVDCPQRNYPRAIGVALAIVVLSYLLPVIAGVSVTTDRQLWTTEAGWPVIAQKIGGFWLGALMAAAGLVSVWALVNAQLFYVSRLPFVLARDGWLPPVLAKLSSSTEAPIASVVVCGAIAAVLAALSFGSLAVIQCLLYAGALTLEFLSLILLRLRRPDASRPFRIPGGWPGMSYVCLCPLGLFAVVFFTTLRDWRLFQMQIAVVAIVVVSGIVFYSVRRNNAAPPGGRDSRSSIEPIFEVPATTDVPALTEDITWRFLRKERLNQGGQCRKIS